MIIAIDIETRGLDATKFIAGCLMKEGCKKPEIFTNKEKLWNRVLELGRAEKKRGKMLNVYSHNAQFDFYGYADLEDSNLSFFSQRPFIASYRQWNEDKGRSEEIVKFLDSLSIYKMSLKKVGDLIGLPKLEMPEELLVDDNMRVTPKLLKKIIPYMVRDTEICLKCILDFKDKIRSEGVNVKRLYTINQIAINHLINEWRKIKDNDFIFWNSRQGETRRTLRAEEIHGAYRGGRVEAFKTGKFKGATYIDCNSLYPFSASMMKFPDLRSERKVWKPLIKNDLKDIISKIGISRVMMFNKSNEIGLLPVRTTSGNYFPKEGKYLIGTYSHVEIRLALREGYELVDMEWSIIYKEAKINPLNDYMVNTYRLRKRSSNVFSDYFYKSMMNCCLGKLAQTRTGQVIVVDSVEKAEEYLNMKYEIIKGVKLNYMYLSPKKDEVRKKYYAPIIPTLVNAWARCFMYKEITKIPKDDLLYSDTDSIMFLGNHLHKFRFSDDMGDFKLEHEDEDTIIYGRKTYAIASDMKVSGFSKRNLSIEDFEKGYIQDKKMITLNTTNDIGLVGSFKDEERDLNKQLDNFLSTNRLMDDEELFIDCDINDISFFLSKVNEVLD